MSSRLKPNVIWVRSFVPKLKNSAVSAIRSAVRAARGISIIVPTMYFTLDLRSLMMRLAVSRMILSQKSNSVFAPTREP